MNDSLLTEVEKRAITTLLSLTDDQDNPLFKAVEVVDGTPRCKTDRPSSVDHWTGQISYGSSGMESFERFAPFAFVCCRLARVEIEGGDANIRLTLDIVIGQYDDQGYARIGREGLIGLNYIFEQVFMAFDVDGNGWHPGTWTDGSSIACDPFHLVDTVENVEDKNRWGCQMHYEANWIPLTQ